jgi:DNA-binding NarL/FixJ family response regulator
MIRIGIVDDQALVRLGLRVLIEDEPGMELVGEASDGAAGVELARRERPDVLLMDIRMPGLDGIAALGAITGDSSLSGTRVIILTTFELDEYVFDALHNGASGFLLKDTQPEELLHGIRLVAQGDALLSAGVTRRVIAEFAAKKTVKKRPHKLVHTLTDREREIVAWVAEGMSNDEIAQHLMVSPATVRTHVSRAMGKLHARDRAQLVVFAFQSGLVIQEF